eukprot:9197802-Alexandrium_andersonii.AAC.1
MMACASDSGRCVVQSGTATATLSVKIRSEGPQGRLPEHAYASSTLVSAACRDCMPRLCRAPSTHVLRSAREPARSTVRGRVPGLRAEV